MLRLIGFMFASAGVVAAFLDFRASGNDFATFVFRDFRTAWDALAPDSLMRAQVAVTERVSAAFWSDAALPAMSLPAAPVLILAGLVFFALGLGGGRPRRYG